MGSIITNPREHLAGLIQAQVEDLNSDLLVRDVDVVESFLPRVDADQLTERCRISLVAPGIDDDRVRVTRCNSAFTTHVPVLIALQRNLDQNDLDIVDLHVAFLEQIMDLCEVDFTIGTVQYSWQTSTPLRDPNGLAYSYEDLSKSGVFTAIYRLRYRLVNNR